MPKAGRLTALALTASLVVVAGASSRPAQGPPARAAAAERLTVVPATKPEDRVTSKLVVQPSHKYRLTVSGFVTATNAKGQAETHDAFYCFGGNCEPPLKGTAFYATPEGYTLTSPIPMTKSKQVPAYHSDHTYVLILDAIPKTGRMVFDAIPHGSANSGVAWSGSFDVKLEDVNPPCVVGKVPPGGHRYVYWKFTQGGPPSRHASDLKDSITAGRGRAAYSRPRDGEARIHKPDGEVCHKDRYDVGDTDGGLLTETLKLEFLPPEERDENFVEIGKKDRFELTVDFHVIESEDPDCPAGSEGRMKLIDAGPGRSSKDRLTLLFFEPGATCDVHEHTYRRVTALIRMT
jgi:hypothetical protein